MKKIVLSLLIIVAFVITSCEKDVEKDFSTLAESSANSYKEAPAYYTAQPCSGETDQGTGYGIKCDIGYSCFRCLGPLPCQLFWKADGTPLETSQMEPWQEYFTEAEIEAWIDGSFTFVNNTEFAENHYQFFLRLHDDDITIHPDDMIDMMEE